MTLKYIFLENYGCTSNKFDSEVIHALLEGCGYIVVKDPTMADLILVNTCGVKKATEDRILSRLLFFKGLRKPIVVSGCLPKIDLAAIKNAIPDYVAVLDPRSIDKIPILMKNVECGHSNEVFFEHEHKIKIGLPKIQSGEILEIVQICEGCLGSCTFCCTRFARGSLFSYPLKEIVKKIENNVQKGIKEFWITAQDVGAYGLDIEENITKLLEEICAIKGEFFLRVGMMNPHHVLIILDQLIEVYKKDKIFKFLHIPVQSGNNAVLKSMNRPYTVEDFLTIIHSFRRAIPDITIATDVICGFPSESEDAFEDSLTLVRKVKPDIVNISKFFPRPGTPAMNMSMFSNEVIKLRSRKMTELCRETSFKQNNFWLNWIGEIIIDERGKNGSWIGRNFAYKPVIIRSKENLMGELLKIHTKNVFPTYLEGEIME
ncbi:MAG: tRNA-t(6)A37 methylthiotransferase [Thermoproteota archaeon]|nr:tRNA-t(6)A37 methylthiotransferase [Thermoproteota archaeon]